MKWVKENWHEGSDDEPRKYLSYYPSKGKVQDGDWSIIKIGRRYCMYDGSILDTQCELLGEPMSKYPTLKAAKAAYLIAVATGQVEFS